METGATPVLREESRTSHCVQRHCFGQAYKSSRVRRLFDPNCVADLRIQTTLARQTTRQKLARQQVSLHQMIGEVERSFIQSSSSSRLFARSQLSASVWLVSMFGGVSRQFPAMFSCLHSGSWDWNDCMGVTKCRQIHSCALPIAESVTPRFLQGRRHQSDALD
jgi:hypothetical protein